MYSVIRQLKVAHAQHEIDHLVWSNQVDLVAVSNSKGEVSLHRLLWLKAWDLQPPTEKCRVTAMAWRPDGKVLAIAYTGGELLLVNVENKSIIQTLQISGEITCVTWLQEKKVETSDKKFTTVEDEGNEYTKFVDYSKDFISKPPCLSNYESGTNAEDANNSLLHKQKQLNILLFGNNEGMLYLSTFGSLSCGAIDLSEKIGCKCSIIDVHLSELLNVAIVTVKDSEDHVKLVYLDTKIFETHIKELFCLAMKGVELQSLIHYLNKSILRIMETWETILLEIDNKLSNYASKVPPGTLSTDFLDLLVFGICSDDMQEFLFRDMTKRGLEKFGQNIEMSYANIQKLLLKNVTKVGQNITYHLSELRGMARFTSRYQALGLEETRISEAISANGSFLIKSGEMQQIINNSMMYYKTFFRWLYSAIISLMDEQVPAEIPNMTQQDVAYIADFLQYFDRIGNQNNTSIGNNEKSGFIMERLGQYLSDSNLGILTTNEQNDWDTLLLNHDCMQKHSGIIKHYKELSIIQQFAHLRHAINYIFHEPELAIMQNMNVIKNIPLIKNIKICTGINTSKDTFLYAFPNDSKKSVYLLELSLNADRDNVVGKAGLLFLRQEGERCTFIDVKFYTENVLSLLLEDRNKQGLLLQCPLTSFRDCLQEVALDVEMHRQDVVEIDVTHSAPVKNIAMTPSLFAVSGFRSVSVVLAENKKKVMLFEMEAEEEEEEDAEMTNSSIRESDVDASMQENSDAD